MIHTILKKIMLGCLVFSIMAFTATKLTFAAEGEAATLANAMFGKLCQGTGGITQDALRTALNDICKAAIDLRNQQLKLERTQAKADVARENGKIAENNAKILCSAKELAEKQRLAAKAQQALIKAQLAAAAEIAKKTEEGRIAAQIEQSKNLRKLEKETANAKLTVAKAEAAAENAKQDALAEGNNRRLKKELEEKTAAKLDLMKKRNENPVLRAAYMEELKAKAEIEASAAPEVERQRVKQEELKLQQAKAKWDRIGNIFADAGKGIKNHFSSPKRVALTVAFMGGAAGLIYTFKYGIPATIRIVEAHLYKPKIQMETSRWVMGQSASIPSGSQDLSDFMAEPELKTQVLNISEQIKKSRESGENLKNIMFYGVPGTGKTMCARAIAGYAGIDYALTSGSEFAKIKDQNQAVEELHKLIRWSRKSKKGLMIFIDEAESFLCDRTSPSATKWSVDMLNAFLQAVPEPTSHNIMFVFATNHPFKIDRAVMDRVGDSLEFTLPTPSIREDILKLYSAKSTAGKNLPIAQSFMDNLPTLSRMLDGVSPRRIKYAVGEAVREARMVGETELTFKRAHQAIEREKELASTKQRWVREQERWENHSLAASAT